MRYAVIQIAGRQYVAEPGKEFLVNSLGEVKQIEAEVLLLADDKSLNVGKPFLKDKLKFDVLEAVRGEKIRVAKYHAKANTRKVRGSRAVLSKIKLSESKPASAKVSAGKPVKKS